MDGLLVRNFEEDSYEILLLDFDLLWEHSWTEKLFPFALLLNRRFAINSSVFQIHTRKLGFAQQECWKWQEKHKFDRLRLKQVPPQEFFATISLSFWFLGLGILKIE